MRLNREGHITILHSDSNTMINRLYVDLRVAFDSLSRSSLWLLLTTLEIPDKIVRLIRALYSNSVRFRASQSASASFTNHNPIFIKDVYWQQTHLPRAWTGCWKELLAGLELPEGVVGTPQFMSTDAHF